MFEIRASIAAKQAVIDLGRMKRGGWVYIMSNKRNGTLYVGMTSNLIARAHSHRSKTDPRSFSARYDLNKLVYYESCSFIEEAIRREKQLKAGSRAKKILLIEGMNPDWKDLFEDLLSEAEGG